MSQCTSCFQGITWAESVNGRRMPVDLHPTPDGNLVLVESADPRQPLVARAFVAGTDDALPRFKSHFATCPNADKHRKKR